MTLEQRSVLETLGYSGGPSLRTLYFDAGRGSETYEGYYLFGLSFRYRIPVWQAIEPWIETEIFSLFNNAKRIAWNTSVTPDFCGPVDEFGLPTAFVKGPRFGEASSADDYPQYLPGRSGLRTFRVSMGFRFWKLDEPCPEYRQPLPSGEALPFCSKIVCSAVSSRYTTDV